MASQYSDFSSVNYSSYKSLVEQLNSDPNHHMVIRGAELNISYAAQQPAALETFLKKLILYAPRAILVTDAQEILHASGSPPPTAGHFERGYSTAVQSLQELVRKANYPDIFFLPSKVQQWITNYSSDDSVGDASEPITSFNFDWYQNPFALEVVLRDPVISHHMLEILNCATDEAKVINVWLPRLSNIPTEVLMKLKADEMHAFQRFHTALKSLVSDRKQLTSEALAKELFQQVDYEVREFEDKMRKIARSQALKNYEVAVGLSAIGLCLALPSDIAKIITSVIGAYQVKDFIQNLFQARDQKDEMKLSGFYIPWLCTKMAKPSKSSQNRTRR
jgi:hypothetical protein